MLPKTSDTPRTDAFMQGEQVAFDALWIDFARTLERERNEAVVKWTECENQLKGPIPPCIPGICIKDHMPCEQAGDGTKCCGGTF